MVQYVLQVDGIEGRTQPAQLLRAHCGMSATFDYQYRRLSYRVPSWQVPQYGDLFPPVEGRHRTFS